MFHGVSLVIFQIQFFIFHSTLLSVLRKIEKPGEKKKCAANKLDGETFGTCECFAINVAVLRLSHHVFTNTCLQAIAVGFEQIVCKSECVFHDYTHPRNTIGFLHSQSNLMYAKM